VVCRGIDVSWILGKPAMLEFKSNFVKAFALLLMLATQPSGGVSGGVGGVSGGASPGSLGLLHLIRFQPGLRVVELVEKKAISNSTIERRHSSQAALSDMSPKHTGRRGLLIN